MPRTLSAIVITLLLTLSAASQDTWQIDPAHTSAQFSVQYDSANLDKSSIQTTIDASSVDTRVEMRDNDLRSPNYLDVQKYPTITFKSRRIEASGAGKLKVTGDLTIHGIT
jgi:polyisoprenoid-binding protein YceI